MAVEEVLVVHRIIVPEKITDVLECRRYFYLVIPSARTLKGQLFEEVLVVHRIIVPVKITNVLECRRYFYFVLLLLPSANKLKGQLFEAGRPHTDQMLVHSQVKF
jgi:hypothetical protein